ncbi:hypothetical protein QT381_02505 [Galbitalea sp. SE-J8]|uniref:hypothetical protein n=1 Tax=Galbitalea sp. SE-J8 TaxID=3054952 RepID=UPI00259CB108|nr:hypothetical protein [Galbitalea sp. SE-J8]MDM4761874.1 hypothetical protein [Galbitalea sp. SE-J8]
MSDDVTLGVLALVGVVITALLGYLGAVTTTTRRHAKAARDGVENNHTVNLRDDLDEQFAGLVRGLTNLAADVGGIKSDLRGIRREALTDRQAAAEDRRRLHNLEDTLTPEQVARLRQKHKETP